MKKAAVRPLSSPPLPTGDPSDGSGPAPLRRANRDGLPLLPSGPGGVHRGPPRRTGPSSPGGILGRGRA